MLYAVHCSLGFLIARFGHRFGFTVHLRLPTASALAEEQGTYHLRRRPRQRL